MLVSIRQSVCLAVQCVLYSECCLLFKGFPQKSHNFSFSSSHSTLSSEGLLPDPIIGRTYVSRNLFHRCICDHLLSLSLRWRSCQILWSHRNWSHFSFFLCCFIALVNFKLKIAGTLCERVFVSLSPLLTSFHVWYELNRDEAGCVIVPVMGRRGVNFGFCLCVGYWTRSKVFLWGFMFVVDPYCDHTCSSVMKHFFHAFNI